MPMTTSSSTRVNALRFLPLTEGNSTSVNPPRRGHLELDSNIRPPQLRDEMSARFSMAYIAKWVEIELCRLATIPLRFATGDIGVVWGC